MAAVEKVLVVGGGFSGMAAAIQMQKAGIAVDLVEIDPNWRPEGAGISVSGPTLRALDSLGALEAFKMRGFVSDGVELATPVGQIVGRIPTPKTIGSEVSGGGGILRPELARILSDAVVASGVKARTGCTYADLKQSADKVEVSFTDGSAATYDLVVVADGVNSATRARLFPEVTPPQYIGQGVWRAVLPRPSEITCPRMWVGGAVKVGVNPVSQTHMYLFITEGRPENTLIDPSTFADHVAELLKPFPDPLLQSLIPQVRQPEASIDYRALANLLVPAPWNRGRVVLIGDTVAATTPHLASGAGIGIESGIVLAEELARASTLQDALDRFHARRWERCRLVVENSEKLCRIEMEHGDMAEHARIMQESTAALLQPI